MRKIFLSFLFLIPFFLMVRVASASTGFIGNPIWIFPEYPREGETATISALFHNGETSKLSGTVLFYDNSTLLGRKSLTINAGDVGTATLQFTVSAGDHVFSASAQGFEEYSASGIATTFPLPLGTAEMPKLFVTKNGSGSGVDAVGLKASAQAVPILNKVDQAENRALDSIPDSVKEPVAATAQSLETWRTTTADNLQRTVLDAQKNVDEQKAIAASQLKKEGKVAPSTQYIDSPFATIKLFAAQFFLYIFSHVFVFYVILFAVLYFLIRSIIRKVKRMRHERRMTRKVANKMGKT